MSASFRRLSCLLLLLLLATRLAAMAWIPLTDDTEARYAEVARKMVENGNWVTPISLDGSPFWAKPPLSTWVSAIGMHLFGVNAFAARLPNLLLMILTLLMVAAFVAQKRGRDAGLLAALIGASMLLIYVTAGTVMTDTCLVFSTTWVLLAFWQARETGQKRWGYLMFAGLGVGLLAKGPVALVLTGMPVFFWAWWQKDLKASIRCLPWASGLLLMLAIALPWYLMAEHRTPGFLRYFFIGENIERFINPAWAGDKYGSSHLHPYGSIWVYWLGAAFPWSLLFIGSLLKSGWQGVKSRFGRDQSLARYLLLAAFMPELFFTLARNIIPTYPLVGLPPLAALMALHLSDRQATNEWRLPGFAAITVLLGLLALLAFSSLFPSLAPKQSQKPVIATWQHLRPHADTPLAYFQKHYYSAYFYSHGQVDQLDSIQALGQYLTQHPQGFVAMRSNRVEELPDALRQRLHPVQSFPYVSLFQGTATGVAP